MMNSKLIVITGPAAAGKSTIAKGLQAELGREGELWLLFELDVFARSLSRDWISVGVHQGDFAERGFAYRRAADSSIELRLGSDGQRFLAAFHRAVAAVVNCGIGVICETIVYDEADWRDWCEALSGISTCWVKLSAPVAVLQAREKSDRSRLFQGLAQGMSARKPVGIYNIEADTSTEAVDAIVQRIAALLKR